MRKEVGRDKGNREKEKFLGEVKDGGRRGGASRGGVEDEADEIREEEKKKQYEPHEDSE
jgi:hypothetical protein